ncbi:MAG: hypothetical protein R3F60_04700 [bacterium]
MKHWLLGAGVALAMVGCDSGGSDGAAGGAGGAGGSGGEAGPTWHQDVAPLLAEKCAGCHHAGGIAPFALDDFAQASMLVPLLVSTVEAGRMPPWGAQETEECQPRPFKDDLRLTPAQLDLLKAWQAAGTPEGDAASAAPIPARSLDALANPSLTMTPRVPFVTEGVQDQFRCFVLDPGFTEDVHVNGAHFLAGNPLVVHHALLYVTEDVEEIARMDDGDGGYDCFGGPAVGAQLVAAWAPGGIPMEFPANAGMPISAGAKFVMQIHYHPTGMSAEEDATSVQLRLTDGPPEYLAVSALIGNFSRADDSGDGLLPGPEDPGAPAFVVPAGARGHVERMRFTVPGELDGRPFPGMFIHSIASHMHYVGTDMRIELTRPEAVPPCEVPELDALEACMTEKCPGQVGAGSVACAQSECAEAVEGLSGVCGECLVAQVRAGAADVYAGCRVPPAPPGQYGTIPEQPADECLLQTPAWDFSWQRFYAYDAPIDQLPFVQAGDVFEWRCTYDNSMDNPFVREALRQQGLDAPHDVSLGEETLDEMCLMALTLLYKWE